MTMKPLPKTVTRTFNLSICEYIGDVVVTTHPVPRNMHLGTAELTFDVPQLTEQEINQQQVAVLVAQSDEIKATASARLQEISEQISRLTCIEHQEEQS